MPEITTQTELRIRITMKEAFDHCDNADISVTNAIASILEKATETPPSPNLSLVDRIKKIETHLGAIGTNYYTDPAASGDFIAIFINPEVPLNKAILPEHKDNE
jgi:hypothetical protein